MVGIAVRVKIRRPVRAKRLKVGETAMSILRNGGWMSLQQDNVLPNKQGEEGKHSTIQEIIFSEAVWRLYMLNFTYEHYPVRSVLVLQSHI